MPPVNNGNNNGKSYWRGLDELQQTPEFVEFMHREFPSGASELLDSGDRRHFLKIMGASFALAGVGLTGCRRWPEETIVPYAVRPEGQTPGKPMQYATSFELNGVSHGVLAISYDGRPIKLEGNPEHPVSRGSSDAIAQAAILNLYDPDRSRRVRHNGSDSSWDAFTDWAKDHFDGLEGNRGSGLAILSEETDSPSAKAMRDQLMARFPDATWHTYEPLSNDNAREGSIRAFGRSFRTHLELENAQTIVSLDADFLSAHPAATKLMRDYAAGRRADDRDRTMNRLYVCEGTFSLTGANADHRFNMRAQDVAVVAARLAAAVVGNPSQALRQALAAFDEIELDTPFIEQMAADLQRHRGRSAVVAGDNQPPVVHWLTHLINEALDNVGETVRYTARENDISHFAALRDLSEKLEAGEVNTLVVVGGNPVYNAPADFEFAAKVEQLKEAGGHLIHLSDYVDETSRKATWHINRAHFLEAWGDGRAYDGTVCISQPLIEPLFNGKSAVEVLAFLAGDDAPNGHTIVQQTFREMTGLTDYERAWRRAVHDGVLSGSALASERPSVRRGNLDSELNAWRERWAPAANDSAEIIFVRDHKIHDGRFANNGWLQELPDPLTKLTWDNAAVMNPAMAKRLNAKTGDMIRITFGDRELDAAVMELPGHGRQSITLSLGYGREFNGRIAAGAGFNANVLRNSQNAGYLNASVSKIRGSYKLATTQLHHAFDSVGGRGKQERLPSIFREATRDEYVNQPKFVNKAEGLHVPHRLSLWEENLPFHRQGGYKGAEYAWAMSIDLSACVGCGACVVACQAENNIPIVGKEQVLTGREMHWIRIDRYFRVDDTSRPDAEENPDAICFQPVTCMHCENAPCEQVCPVAATVHDEDGLNVMVYNRCIGTRYCSNNCPYKVRRFNYFDYHRRKPYREIGYAHVDREYFTTPQAAAHPIEQMQFNPEVTIRVRGVMEKCTFCVQRISIAKIDARSKRRRERRPDEKITERIAVEDGSFTTACAQACPAKAIEFGDLLDENSRVVQKHRHERGYELLEEFNTKPRLKYLGKLRNPRQDTEVAASITTAESEAKVHA
ncbi:MAG: 4Fe-4S dicluster domain-containing protein [Phycisphaerales bacterium]|nr:MAG: 4Fe-4S dicluster domain-containing protein [Phycisphaerales bacterium]